MNSETEAIDSKKQTTSTTTETNITVSTIITYMIIIIIVILLVCGYFGIGGFILYACKLAQSNVLPTDVNCFPYTNVENKIDPVNINIFTTNDNPPLSEKIQFPYDIDNKKNTIIDSFRNYKEKSNANFLACYFISILDSFISANYSIFNTFFNALNTNFSENLIIFMGPILLSVIAPLLIIIDYIYFVYLWFSNMSWFFKTNINESDEGAPEWEDISFTEPLSYGMSVGIAFIFAIIGIVTAVSGIPLIVSLFIVLLCIITIVTYKCKLNNSPANVMTIVKNVFKTHKVALNITISLFIVLFAFTNINAIFGIISLLIIGIIYYRGTPDLFVEAMRDGGKLSALSSYEQANKVKCKAPPKKEAQGVVSQIKEALHIPGLPSIRGIMDFWGLGSKNKNLTKEMIKLGGRLNTNNK
jgi:hypothetical protein